MLVTGVFYTVVMLAQTLGFGVSGQGTENFANSPSPLGDLSKSYVGPAMAAGVDFGVMISAIASALVVVMVIAIGAFVAQRIGGVCAVNAFFYPGTIGVLSLLVAYIVTNAGALRFLFLSRRVPAWEAIFPMVGLAILVYVIYRNIFPVPDFPFNLFPYMVAAWLVVGLGIVLLIPGLSRRIGASLAEQEGLAVEENRPRP